MAPTPETTCSACGKPVDPSDKACKGCGAMIGAPSSGFSLDAEHERKPSTMAPKPPPPPAKEAAPKEQAGSAEPELEMIDLGEDEPAAPADTPAPPKPPADEPPVEKEATEKTVAEKAAEKARDEPKGETVRMSLADATQAWLEDTPNTTAVIDEDIDDLVPPKSKRTLLFVVLGIAVVALAALLLLLK